jgi:nucleoside-diphosphate-sugar epimerase
MRGIDVVYHIAAAYREAQFPDSYYFDVNVGGTALVLKFAEQERVRRVVHCSTVGVHGEIHSIPADENAPLNPGDAYQESKLEAERIAQQAFASGLQGVVFRPVGIYGPGDKRFLKLFRTVHSGQFRMFGDGDVLYHLTYIDDLIDGILLCGERAEAAGNLYILAGPRYTTLKELIALVAQAVESPRPTGHLPLWPLLTAAAVCEAACRPLRIDPPLHRRRCDFFTKNRAFSIDKARRELGFEPRVDLVEGLGRTARWYFQQGLLRSHGKWKNSVAIEVT